MIEQTGRVLAVRAPADARPARLQVELPRRGACGGCAQSAGCGTAALAGLFGQRPPQVELALETAVTDALAPAASPVAARSWHPGERIRLGIEPRALLAAAVLAYLLPLVLMLLGALLGEAWGSHLPEGPDWRSQGASVLLASLGLAAGLGVGRWLIRARGLGLAACLTARAATADPAELTTVTMIGDLQ